MARKVAKLEVGGSRGWRGMLFLDERVEDCSDSHHSRAAGAIPATPANESLPSGKDRDSQKSGCEMSHVW